uniref:Uncharacterized protein n=1 Tax=Sus scrofa TaxID=9823 RepID=A0A8D1Y9V1_PIG
QCHRRGECGGSRWGELGGFLRPRPRRALAECPLGKGPPATWRNLEGKGCRAATSAGPQPRRRGAEREGSRGEGEHPRTYHEHGDPGGQRVEEHRGHGAAVLRARVGLAVGAVVAEEALHVHGERVRVLEVVRQHHRPCHDHHLEIEHAAGCDCRMRSRKSLPGLAERAEEQQRETEH